MNCYHCDQSMASGSATFKTWGHRTVCVHQRCDRTALINRAYEMNLFASPAEERSDQELIDAIAAEKLSGEWLDRLERLPTDEDRREAVHRLAQDLIPGPLDEYRGQ